MYNQVPSSWSYSNELENLFFFFQCSEELLSFNSPDSFRLPVCNSMVLCNELRQIYSFLTDGMQIERYYSKYIPCIIDELIASIQQDSIIKQHLGLRLDMVVTGLQTAKNNPQELMRWIRLISQLCTLEEHKHECEQRIRDIIHNNGKDRRDLLWLAQNYYIDLKQLGYSYEYMYFIVMRYLGKKAISSKNAIDFFFDVFDCSISEYEFWVVADTNTVEEFEKTVPGIGRSFKGQQKYESQIRRLARGRASVQNFLSTYRNMKKKGSVKLLSFRSKGIDPYSAFDSVSFHFHITQCFEGYFKHKSEKTKLFDILWVKDSDYVTIRRKVIVPRRPQLEKTIIDKRINKILRFECCSRGVLISLLNAMEMHLDAINCRNEDTMLRTFWTALEALFFTSDESEEKENAQYSMLHIIQKTYLLKQFRLIYEQLVKAVSDKAYLESIGAMTFSDFIVSFMSVQADDEDFRQFTAKLENNPLLRSRLYWFRKELKSPESLRKKIENHNTKVNWQIARIYRYRNMSTHAGAEMEYKSELLFNLHNYFDYVINYIICKLENDCFIESIASMVFEAKNDNQIHIEYLKKLSEINDENLRLALFGPDSSIVSFDFEAVMAVESDEDLAGSPTDDASAGSGES